MLPYIDVHYKGYIISPSKRALREEGQYRSNSPSPFIPEDLEVTVAITTPTNRPRHKRKKKTSNTKTHSPSPPQEVPNIPTTIYLEDSTVEMPLQRSRITLAKILGMPTGPQGQIPTLVATTSTPPSTSSVLTVTIAPACETRAGRKRPRVLSSEQPLTIPDFEKSPPDLGDSHVGATGAPAYIKVFMVDGEVFPATDRVRP